MPYPREIKPMTPAGPSPLVRMDPTRRQATQTQIVGNAEMIGRQKGVTLIELLITVVIVAILSYNFV